MSENLPLIIASLFMIAVGFTIFFIKVKNTSIAYIYILYLTQYFGILSLIDGFLNEYNDYNQYFIIAAHAIPFFSVLVLYILLKYTNKMNEAFSINTLVNITSDIKIYKIRLYAIYGLIVSIIVKYFVISYYADEIIRGKNGSLTVVYPYFFKIIVMLSDPILLITAILFFIISIKNNNKYYLCDIVLLLISIIYLFVLGRTILLIFITLAYLLYATLKKINISKMIIHGMLCIFILMLLGNYYQAYRVDRDNYVHDISDFLNFDGLISNIKERETSWRFVYLLMNQRWEDGFMPDFPGKLTLEISSIAIPSIFLDDKVDKTGDEIICDAYNILLKDHPSGDVATLFSDFGIFSPILVALKFLFLQLVFYGIYKLTIKKYPLITVFYLILFTINVLSIDIEFDTYVRLFINSLLYGILFLGLISLSCIFPSFKISKKPHI